MLDNTVNRELTLHFQDFSVNPPPLKKEEHKNEDFQLVPSVSPPLSLNPKLSNAFVKLNANFKRMAKCFHMRRSAFEAISQDYFRDLFTEKISQIARIRFAENEITNFQKNPNPFLKQNLKKIICASAALSTRKPKGIFKINNKLFLMFFNKKNKLKIYDINTPLVDRAHQGGNSNIFLAKDLSKDKSRVFKQARRTIIGADKQIKNEDAILSRIHSEGFVLGIQKKTKMMIHVTQGEPCTGYLGIRYDGDYTDDFINGEFIDQRIHEFYQLLFGLSHLEKLGIIHADLKPENIFVKTLNGRKSVYIADFGGACDSANIKTVEDLCPLMVTKAYCLEDELFFHGMNIQKKLALLHKRDVFALGSTFFIALTGKFPFTFGKDGYPIYSSNYELMLKDAQVTVGIQNLIKMMLNPDYQKRYSPQQAFQKLDEVIRLDYPEIHAQIKEDDSLQK